MPDDVVVGPVHGDAMRTVGVPFGIGRQRDMGDSAASADVGDLPARLGVGGVVRDDQRHAATIANPGGGQDIDDPWRVERDCRAQGIGRPQPFGQFFAGLLPLRSKSFVDEPVSQALEGKHRRIPPEACRKLHLRF